MPTLASIPCAGTHGQLSHKARDLELAKMGARPCTPRITAGPAASLRHSMAPGPPFHLCGTSGNSFLLDYQAGLANQEQAGSRQERRKEAPGKRQFRSAGEEPTPNLTSVKMRKRTTASHLNPNVLLTFLSYLDNSQNLLKHEEKKKIPLFPHSIHRNEVGLEMQLP